MDKALQLVEGSNVAAFWAHLMDAYNYFEVHGTLENENTLYQSAKVIQSFTRIGTKAQNSAKKRLAELGFLKYRVASKPGEATKTTIFILYPDVFQRWIKDHDYDKLRDEKYKELQNPDDKARLDQWISDNAPALENQSNTDLDQMQTAEGTFANHTQGHLQSSPGDISKLPKDNVIETIEVDTIEVETTQTKEKGVVYDGKEYEYLQGKNKGEILELIINAYSDTIRKNVTEGSIFSDERYIGSINKIEALYNQFEIEVCVNFYICILGYLQNLSQKLVHNPKAFDVALKLENVLRFKQEEMLSVENKMSGERKYISLHKPVKIVERPIEQSM